MNNSKLKKLFSHAGDKNPKTLASPDVDPKKGGKSPQKAPKNLSDSSALAHNQIESHDTKILELQSLIREKDEQIIKLQKELEKLRALVKGPVHAQNYRGDNEKDSSDPKTNELLIKVEVFPKDPQTSKKILESLANNMYMKNLQKDQLTEIVKSMFLESYKKDETILKEGEVGDFMFLVEDGQLELSKGDEIIGKLGPGQAFGEHSFLYGCKRTTNVIAISDCKLWVLSKQTFEQIMLNTMYTRQKLYLKLLNKVPLFNEIPDYNLCKIVDILHEVRYSSKETVYFQGNKGETLYIIKQGTVEFFKKRASVGDGVFIRVLSEGSYFGEKSLLGEEYYAFDARAGQTGCVLLQIEREYHVVPKSDPRISYALKQIKKKNIVNSNLQNNIIKEKRLLMEVNSNFVVNRSLNENAARFYIACLIEGINHLHTLNIIFRDLKPANILIDDKGYCKLTNFIYSKKIQPGRKTYSFCGTPEYVAPEGHDSAVDYWGLGILTYEMLVGSPPFTGDDPIKTYNIIMKGFETVGFPANVSRNAQALVRKLCKINPNERIGYPKKNFVEIQKHKWFEGFNWQNLKNMVMDSPIIPKIKDMTESFDEEDEFPRDDEIPPDETSGWDKDF